MAHDWHKSSRLAWQHVRPTGNFFFFLELFSNLSVLMGAYLQYLHDHSTDEMRQKFWAVRSWFWFTFWGDLTCWVRGGWAEVVPGYGTHRRGVNYGFRSPLHWVTLQRRSTARRLRGRHIFMQTHTERSGPGVQLEIARNSSVGVLTWTCTELTHTHDAGLAQWAKVRFNSRRRWSC